MAVVYGIFGVLMTALKGYIVVHNIKRLFGVKKEGR